MIKLFKNKKLPVTVLNGFLGAGIGFYVDEREWPTVF
jgi:hypothetical protein